jgi:hypothetical protein
MARTIAALRAGSRITDYVSLGVITKTFPFEKVNSVLRATGKTGVRQRDLPAHVVVYYVIALALYMRASYREVLRCLLEGLQWLLRPSATLKVAGKSGISQARTRLGAEPLKRLYEEVAAPIGTTKTVGAWYRAWRLVSLDGSTLDVADTAANEEAFGRPAASRGASAFPQVRFVGLLENGPHVLFAVAMDGCRSDELTLAKQVIGKLGPDMLCLADRYYPGYQLWRQAQSTGADLLWRGRKNLRLEREKRLPDGSFLSRIYQSTSDQRNRRNGIVVRVIEYTLEGVPDAEPMYRLLTTILDHRQAAAKELASLYPERWEYETALDELKTHLRGAQIVLRSKTPELVRQEFYGLMLAHLAIRGLMHEAALEGGEDPDRLSFVHSVRVIRRRLPRFVAISPSAQESFS